MIAAKTPVAVFVGAVRRARRLGRLHHHDRRRHRRDGARHAHRRGASGVRRRREMDETMAKKAAADVAAYARTLARQRGRNVQLAEQAVTESRAFTEEEALTAHAAARSISSRRDVADLLQEARRPDRHALRRPLRDAAHGAATDRAGRDDAGGSASSARSRTRNIAYLLLSLGMLGLTIELWSPGAILPGVVGGAVPAAGVLRPAGAAGQLRRAAADALRAACCSCSRSRSRATGCSTVGGVISLVFGSHDADRFAGAGAAAEPAASILPVVLGLRRRSRRSWSGSRSTPATRRR